MGQKVAWIGYRPLTWMACNGPLRIAVEIRAYAMIWGDKRRIKSISERSKVLMGWYRRDVRGAESVSPIDYEIEQAHTFDLVTLIESEF